jgi:hypothetical protein
MEVAGFPLIVGTILSGSAAGLNLETFSWAIRRPAERKSVKTNIEKYFILMLSYYNNCQLSKVAKILIYFYAFIWLRCLRHRLF